MHSLSCKLKLAPHNQVCENLDTHRKKCVIFHTLFEVRKNCKTSIPQPGAKVPGCGIHPKKPPKNPKNSTSGDFLNFKVFWRFLKTSRSNGFFARSALYHQLLPGKNAKRVFALKKCKKQHFLRNNCAVARFFGGFCTKFAKTNKPVRA